MQARHLRALAKLRLGLLGVVLLRHPLVAQELRVHLEGDEQIRAKQVSETAVHAVAGVDPLRGPSV